MASDNALPEEYEVCCDLLGVSEEKDEAVESDGGSGAVGVGTCVSWATAASCCC